MLVLAEDNFVARHEVDTQGNITGPRAEEEEENTEENTDSEVTSSEDTTTGRCT